MCVLYVCVCACVGHCLGARTGQGGGREQMWVIDGGRLNGELLRLGSCKLVRTDAISLTEDTGPSITLRRSSRGLHIQMATEPQCVVIVCLLNIIKEQVWVCVCCSFKKNDSLERQTAVKKLTENK